MRAAIADSFKAPYRYSSWICHFDCRIRIFHLFCCNSISRQAVWCFDRSWYLGRLTIRPWVSSLNNQIKKTEADNISRFALGPIVWAPFSELYGRRLPLIISSFAFSIFSVAVAVGKDAQTVFICRFFSGFMGACPLTCVGAVFADMFNNRTRGIAVTVFSVAVFSGPLLAPFIGGFIDSSYLGWRWTEYITAIMGFVGLALLLLLMEETYPPIILVNKASELRRRTKNWGIHAKQEEIEIDLRELLEKNLSRPVRMLVSEPIVLALSIYVSKRFPPSCSCTNYHTDEFRLWHPLSLSRILPHRFPRSPRYGSGCRRSTLLRHDPRGSNRCRLHCHYATKLQPQVGSEQQHANPRVALTTSNRWWRLLFAGHLLVWVSYI